MKPNQMILHGIKDRPSSQKFNAEEERLARLFLHVLDKADINDRATLIKKCQTEKGRKAVSEATGLGHETILRFANYIDLMRVKGIDERAAVLLEHSGVDSPLELSKRIPENLIKILAENTLNFIAPKLEEVNNWISQCKDHGKLPQMIFHGEARKQGAI